METKKKPLYWIFAKSFTDMKSYKNFVSKNFLRAFLYVVILTLLLSFIYSTYYVFSIDSYATELINQLNTRTPEFVIENGKLVTKDDQPVVLSETSDKGTLVILDTKYTGSITQYEEYETVIVLGYEDIYLSNPNIRYLVNYESILGTEQLTSKALLESINGSKTYIYGFLYIIIFVWFLINYLSYAILVSLIVGIVRRFSKKPTDFGLVMQLSAYALTLPAILYVLWLFTSFNLLFDDFIFLLLAYFIAWKGVDAYYTQTHPSIKDKDKLV